MATVHSILAPTPVLYIQIDGQINKHQDVLKELGYHWSKNITDGIMGYFDMKEPSWKFVKVSSEFKTIDDVVNWVQSCEKELAEHGYTLKVAISELDMTKMAHDLQKAQDNQAKADEWIAKNPKPSNKEALGFMFEKHGSPLSGWNGKIYGRKGGYNYYYNGKKHNISDEQQKAITDYQSDLATWEAKRKEAGV